MRLFHAHGATSGKTHSFFPMISRSWNRILDNCVASIPCLRKARQGKRLGFRYTTNFPT